MQPAEDTPLSALALAQLAHEAGIPPGVINILTSSRGRSAEVGRALCSSPLVSGLSFTGSTRVGKILYSQCADTVKRLGLELGGNAPFIVFETADLDLAVAGCMASKFRNAGQTCVSTNRVLVQRSVAAAFTEKLRAAMEQQLVLGDPAQPGVTIGPLINAAQHAKVAAMVEAAVSAGASVALGGGPSPVSPLHFSPTILTEVREEMEVFQEEIFGPVVSLATFSTEQEALDIANNCRTGLAAYFYSGDVAQCWRVARRLETGAATGHWSRDPTH